MIKQICSIVFIMALVCSAAISQDSRRDNSKKHERMKAKKIAYITDALDLTPSESEKFWPIYNEFKKEFEVLEEGSYSFGREVSESEAKELLDMSIIRDKKMIELKEKYNAKFLACISAKKLVKLRGVERKFRKDVLSTIRDRYAAREKRKG